MKMSINLDVRLKTSMFFLDLSERFECVFVPYFKNIYYMDKVSVP